MQDVVFLGAQLPGVFGTPKLATGLFGSSIRSDPCADGGCAIQASRRRRRRAQQNRPDLALDILPEVRAPSLFILGEADADLLALNRDALDCLTCERMPAIFLGGGRRSG